MNTRSPGPRRTVSTSENVERVRQAMLRSPFRSSCYLNGIQKLTQLVTRTWSITFLNQNLGEDIAMGIIWGTNKMGWSHLFDPTILFWFCNLFTKRIHIPVHELWNTYHVSCKNTNCTNNYFFYFVIHIFLSISVWYITHKFFCLVSILYPYF